MKSITRDVEVLWKDTKRFLGMPLTFTNYAIIRKPGQWVKIVEESGIFSTHVEEVMAYRIDDISIYQSLVGKIFGVGNITIYCKDASTDVLVFKNIKKPYEVKNILTDVVERERKNRNIHYSEVQY